MSIYFGNNKIDKIYVGNTKISKVYQGSTLVFDASRKIAAYGYDGCYLLGSNSTSGVVIKPSLSTLATISGTLGTGGSTIKVTGDETGQSDGETYSYYQTLTFGGVRLHMYAIIDSTVRVFWAQYVAEDAKVGSKCGQFLGGTNYPDDPSEPRYYPRTVTSNSMTYATSPTYARVAANDTNYTRNGFKS